MALRGQPGIHLAKEIMLRRGEAVPAAETIIAELGLPFFIKPNASGSSFGVTKIKSPEQIAPAIEAAFEESDAVMLEQFVDGREVSCGIMVAGGKEWVPEAPCKYAHTKGILKANFLFPALAFKREKTSPSSGKA